MKLSLEMEALEDPIFLHSLPNLLGQVDKLRGGTLLFPFKTSSGTIALLC